MKNSILHKDRILGFRCFLHAEFYLIRIPPGSRNNRPGGTDCSQVTKSAEPAMTMKRIQIHHWKSLLGDFEQYTTEAQCEAALKRMRWPDGLPCPRCGAYPRTACCAAARPVHAYPARCTPGEWLTFLADQEPLTPLANDCSCSPTKSHSSDLYIITARTRNRSF